MCGVWIASGADDKNTKEEQPREGGVLVLVSVVLAKVRLVDPLPREWLVLFIERGPGPLPKY